MRVKCSGAQIDIFFDELRPVLISKRRARNIRTNRSYGRSQPGQ